MHSKVKGQEYCKCHSSSLCYEKKMSTTDLQLFKKPLFIEIRDCTEVGREFLMYFGFWDFLALDNVFMPN